MEKPTNTEIHAFIRQPTGTSPCRGLGLGNESYRPLVAVWLLEAVLMLGLYKKQTRGQLPDIFESNSSFMKITELKFPQGAIVHQENEFDPFENGRTKLSNRQIASLLVEKRKHWGLRKPPKKLPLIKNVEILGKHLGLNAAEMAILFFAAFNEANNPFDESLMDWTEKFGSEKLTKFISRLTGYPERAVTSALHPEGALARIGLLTIDSRTRDFDSKFKVMRGLVTTLSIKYRNDAQLLAKFMTTSGPGDLVLADFEHLKLDVDAVRKILQGAQKKKACGVNILFYGDPGTGKTELAKAIANAIGCPLFEVTYKGDEGEVLDGDERLKAYSFCQRILEKSPASLVMFDEVEDVFSSESSLMEMFGFSTAPRAGKAWINRIMESNPVPSIWITNNQHIDPAYRRRFHFSVRFPTPPKKARLKMVEHHLGWLSSDEDWLGKIASNTDVSPAQFSTAAKVAKLAGEDTEERKELALRTLDRSIRLLGQSRQPQGANKMTAYNLTALNADFDLKKLMIGLKRLRSGSLCLYGPPGTGKSEFARHIADEIGKPLLLKRASDLMSKWVGETEQMIAAMFEEARESESVLLLDEADSFLRDRRGAHSQWEITQVNELLTQMEAFEGLFVCTTNLMENLDQASLRRFSFKIKLGYLMPDQRWGMFKREFDRIGGKLDDANTTEALVRRLDRLTPGDFSVVVRQIQFQDEVPSAATFYGLLERECRAKGNSSSIGFIG